MTTERPYKHQHLYDVSIEELSVSPRAMGTLKRSGINTIGDCVDFYITFISREPQGHLLRSWLDVYDEIEQKLKDHAYWSFVEDGLNKKDTKS